MATVSAAVADLSKFFAGELLLPDSPTYASVRGVHNGGVDKRPMVIARCRGVADIAESVGLARAQGLEIAVRGGGHNVAGRCSIDGGLMIDLSLLRSTI